MQYYWQKESMGYFTIRVTRFGCNSEIIDTASTKREAQRKVDKRNITADEAMAFVRGGMNDEK